MEVIVSLIDKVTPRLAQELEGRLSRVVLGPREGAVNSDAPACSTSSILRSGGVSLNLSNYSENCDSFKIKISHELLNKAHMS